MPPIHELYWAYSAMAVQVWFKTGYPILTNALKPHVEPPSRDWVSAEALAAAVATGCRALEGLSDPLLEKELQNQAFDFAVLQGTDPEVLSLYDRMSQRADSDDQCALLLGRALLQRCGVPNDVIDNTASAIPFAIGSFLFGESVLGWRRAQDHV